jgi:50S ribosomal protein L16 3-hydroxylase
VPAALAEFAADAVRRIVDAPQSLECALGEWLSEPKPKIWFDEGCDLPQRVALVLDRRTRMVYDDQHVFINGESFVASGRDALLMRTLADQRSLDAKAVARLGQQAWELVQSWAQQGWLHARAG